MRRNIISRDDFCEIVHNTIGKDLLETAFCYGEFSQWYEFTWFRYEDEFYILHRDSGIMINWYKHLGRVNPCSGPVVLDVTAYPAFFSAFKKDVESWMRAHDYALIRD